MFHIWEQPKFHIWACPRHVLICLTYVQAWSAAVFLDEIDAALLECPVDRR
jgi:hypothetical protein